MICAMIGAMPSEDLPPLAPFPDLSPSPPPALDASAGEGSLLSESQRREFTWAAGSLQRPVHPMATDDSTAPQEGDFLITPDEKTPVSPVAEAVPRHLLEEEPVSAADFLDVPGGDDYRTSIPGDGFSLTSLAAALTSSPVPGAAVSPDPEPDEWSVAALIAPPLPAPHPVPSRDEFLPATGKALEPITAPVAIETALPALITAAADHSTAASPESSSFRFQPAAFPQFPLSRAARPNTEPEPYFDEPLPFPVPSATGLVQAAPSAAVESGDPADRGFGMMMSGALLIILGMVLACRIPGLALEADSTAAAARGPAAVHTWHLHGQMLFSAAAAAGLLILGIGSATLRRWAPPLIHATGWVILLTVLVSMGAATASMFYLSSNATAGDAVSGDGTLVFALTGAFGIALPLGLIALFQRPSIAPLCHRTEDNPRWTDRRTVPGLMVFVTGVLLAVACLTLSIAHTGMPFFGEIGDGPTGIQAWAAAGVISAVAAAFAAAGKRAGWWILLILSSVLALSLFFTCQRHDWRTLAQLPASPGGSVIGGIIAASAMLPAILILLMTRRALAHRVD